MANTRLRVYGKGGTAMWMMFALAGGLLVMALATALPKYRDLAGQRPVLVGLAVAMAIVGWILSRALAYRIEVRDGELRVVGATTLEIGAPRTLRRGQFAQTIRVRGSVVGHTLLDGEQTTTAWLAVEGATAKPVVFTAALGVVGKIDWPHGRPPEAHATYNCGPRMIRKLEHTVGDLV
jgi:hypothetical protein